eukprot:CAMPEP_0113900894 /NCGR_PEP_ID=MMETSP0780_2-20120614/20943_1 /TAXON_ID=652834 /ORGANISM="Palpitomonas bilix" /LENGTH=285 /DNA_ID=CAMNT_0000893429 /DNA_START=245 /DNA_END=1098 /DNA_ORIENTATION=+ /assembly_acc=CAM_ASM_000599
MVRGVRCDHFDVSHSRDIELSSGGDLRLLSYNLFLRPPLVPPHNRHDHKAERLDLFARDYLHAYDIVFLQEYFTAFTPQRRWKLNRVAKEGGFKAVVGPPAYSRVANKCAVDGGTIIVSRLPLLSSSSIVFEQGVFTDRLAAKGVVYARLKAPGRAGEQGGVVHAFNTHLQASYVFDKEGVAEKVRASQLQSLIAFVKETTADLPSAPILLAGDFNIDARASATDGNSDGAEYRQMLDMFEQGGLKLRDVKAEVGEKEKKGEKHAVTFADVVGEGEATRPRDTTL